MNLRELKSKEEIEAYLTDSDGQAKKELAVDLEGEFNLHCYGEHLCLIQIFDKNEAVFIDPFRFKDAEPWRRVFEEENTVKIIYDCTSDGSLLLNEYNITIKNILDLRIAARELDLPRQGLSAVLEDTLSIITQNKKKFQRHNWMRRPLKTEAVEYALSDVFHLFRLRDTLLSQLDERGKLDIFEEQNHNKQFSFKINDPVLRHKKAKGYKFLAPKQKLVFEKTYNIRDTYARKLNVPPNSMFPNKDLLQMSKQSGTPADAVFRSVFLKAPADVKNDFIREIKEVFSN